MLLHFIFLVQDEDLEKRKTEYEYVQQMAQFYKVWIKKYFFKDFEIRTDEMITKPRNFLQRLDTHVLLQDHTERGKEIYHFYLSHFKPFWTDCTCEGYHAENFGMMWWQRPKNQNDFLFLAEKNCTTVSHELAHELLRQAKYKRYIDDVHDIWTKHFYAELPFERYGKNFDENQENPLFQTINMSSFRL